MATYTANVPDAQLGTDAGFRAYLQHVLDVITQGGTSTRVTRTADTGQINELTVSQPGNAATVSNGPGNWVSAPAIFKVEWTDLTFYMRLEFGSAKRTSGTTTADLGQFLIRATCGLNTDGAGNLSDIFMPWVLISSQYYGNLSTSRGLKKSYCCELDGFLAFVIEPTSANSNGYPSTAETDNSTYLVISKRPGSGKKTLLTIRPGLVSYTYNGIVSEYTGANTVDNAFVGAARAMICDLDAQKNPTGSYVNMSTGLANATNGVSSIGGNTYTVRATVPAYDGFYEDPNIVFAYYGDTTYEGTFTISDDLGTRTFMTLKPALRLTVPRYMVMAIRWE